MNLVVVGVGGHAVAVWDIAQQLGFKISAFLDPSNGNSRIARSIVSSGIPIETYSSLSQYIDKPIFIAVGDNSRRHEIFQFLQSAGVNNFPNLISKSSSVSMTAQLGIGNLIGNNSCIGPHSRIGNFAIINSGASIDHECEVLDFASLSPASVLAGNVFIGQFTFVGMNSSVRQNLKIGFNCLIGANSYVNSNLIDNLYVWGTPATIQGTRALGESFEI